MIFGTSRPTRRYGSAPYPVQAPARSRWSPCLGTRDFRCDAKALWSPNADLSTKTPAPLRACHRSWLRPGQRVSGAVTFVVGELLKLVLVVRLFSLRREKLMRIPAFARLYGWYSQAMAWLKATEAWRTLESLARSGREYFKTIGRAPRALASAIWSKVGDTFELVTLFHRFPLRLTSVLRLHAV
jgi:hypothetical protein